MNNFSASMAYGEKTKQKQDYFKSERVLALLLTIYLII